MHLKMKRRKTTIKKFDPTSFLIDPSASMSKGSIIKSLKALRRRNGLKDDSHLGSSFSLLTSQESLSSMLNKSESHLDQSPI